MPVSPDFRAAAVAAAVLIAVLVVAAPAHAHAFLTKSEPAAGSVVRSAPREVRLFFDEPVLAAPGIAVSRGGAGSVVASRPYVPADNPKEIVIPLRKGLGAGPYAVGWSEIDVEDGHLISGAFVFVVGAGLPPTARAAVQGGGGPPLSAVISRWLLLAGLLVAAGAVAFDLLVARLRPTMLLVGGALTLAVVGAVLSVVLEPGASGTHFGRRTLVGAAVAAAGAACALGSVRLPRLRIPASMLAFALLALPTATGHADAPDVPHAVSIPADLAHIAAAAVWLGGIVMLAVIVPRGQRAVLGRRFAPYALAAVALLGASGVVRAVNEFASVHQLWTTGYGRALLVKTGVLAGVLVLAWLNRRRVARAGLAAELALLAVVIGAVAVLTNVRPGLAYPVAAPPAGASRTVVYAGEDDDLAVALAVTPRGAHAVGLRTTVLGFTGPVAGLDVRVGVDGQHAPATACGAGCYGATVPLAGRPRSIAVTIARSRHPTATLRFAGPAQWPAEPALAIVRRAESVIDGLRTLVVHSWLASDARHEVTTVYRMVAPDRLAYVNGDGSGSVIIGNRRWDRQHGGRWIESPQNPPVSQPAPFWSPEVADAHVLRTARVDGRAVWVVSFLDRSTPAWFTAWIDRSSYRTLRLEMVAVAHFMHDRDGPFNAPLSIEPPGA